MDDLIELLSERSSVRSWAAIALARIQPASAPLPVLLQALQNEGNYEERSLAAEAQGRMGKHARAALPELHETLQDGSRAVRDAAWQAIQQVTGAE